MSIQRTPMTRPGYERLRDELDRLKRVDRHAITKAIAEARSHGDLSENAEYHAAKEKQSFIEGRIAELEGKLAHADVIDTSRLQGKTVKFGATVKVTDEDTGESFTYKIVGEDEANVKEKKISISSPIARAMIGKEEGDTAEVSAPGGAKSFEIVSIAWK